MRWDCLAAIIHNPYNPDMLTTFWKNRTEQMTNYFGGATPGSGNCACGETFSCFNASLPCNCDVNDDIWHYDEGFVTNKAELPIHSFFAGDTGSLPTFFFKFQEKRYVFIKFTSLGVDYRQISYGQGADE